MNNPQRKSNPERETKWVDEIVENEILDFLFKDEEEENEREDE